MDRMLPDDIHTSIQRLCGEGDSLVETQSFKNAITRFEQALELLPEPREKWEAATWIYTALGDTHFHAGEFEHARQALTTALLCPNALGNPFIWLRRGEIYFELGELKHAEDSLASAYMLGGHEIFKNEDPKYAAFILPKLTQNSSLISATSGEI
jgi:tetratricopeptide (TPR) repeat protein